MLFYVGGVFTAGLVYPQLLANDDGVTVACQSNTDANINHTTPDSTSDTSPFVDIFYFAGISIVSPSQA